MRFRILLSLGSPQVENINEEIFFLIVKVIYQQQYGKGNGYVSKV